MGRYLVYAGLDYRIIDAVVAVVADRDGVCKN